MNRPLKLAHHLNQRVLHPNDLQKTSTKHAYNVLCERTWKVLTFYSNKHGKDWINTANVIKRFATVVNIVNVRAPCIGRQKRDPSRDPITSDTDWKLEYLRETAVLLKQWEESKLPGLNNPTMKAWQQMCTVLADFAIYLLKEKKLKYVLLGKMQSDRLEHRFSRYRQMSGAIFLIPDLRAFQNERRIRARSLIEFSSQHPPNLHM